jgi:hypothetical protein
MMKKTGQVVGLMVFHLDGYKYTNVENNNIIYN